MPQPAVLLGHTLLPHSIQMRLCEPLTCVVLSLGLSIIPVSKGFFSENVALPLSLQETVNAGD